MFQVEFLDATDVRLNPSQTNRFVYFKNTAQINSTVNDQKPVKNTILINPNFKSTSVHINPNFTGTVCSKPSVYINPNVFKTTHNYITTQACAAIQRSVIASSALSNYCVQRTNTFVNRVKTSTVNASKPIISTPTKLVRLPANQKLQKPGTTITDTFAKPQRIVKSQYSIVKTNVTDVRPVIPLRVNNSHKVKSKFKIDNRIATAASTTKKDLYKSRNVISVSPRKRNVGYVKIGGVLFKKSRMKLQRSGSFDNKNQKKKLIMSKRRIHKIINKNGVRYEVNINRRTLKRMSNASSTTKRTIAPKKKVLLAVLSAKKNFVKSPVLKRKFTPPSHKLKKCNVPCMFYRKFGRCRGQSRGSCNKVHDPAQIIICPR